MRSPVIAYFVPVALQAFPSDVTANGRAKQQARHRDAAASGEANELDAAAGVRFSTLTDRSFAREHRCRQPQARVATRGGKLRCSTAHRHCEYSSDPNVALDTARRFVVAQDVVAVFGGAAAIRVVIRSGRFAVVPQHLSGGGRRRSAASAGRFRRSAGPGNAWCRRSRSRPSAWRLPKCSA